jgi:hypothetical protein
MKIHRFFVFGLSLLGGCEAEEEPSICEPFQKIEPPDIPLVRQTEHLDIHSESFVCAGTALEMERHAQFMAEQFDIDLRSGIPVHLIHGKLEHCPDGAAGCFSDGAIFGSPHSMHHELGHAVSCQLGNKVASILLEGFAVMFEPNPSTTIPAEGRSLAEQFEVTWKDLSYSNAGHFARWLFEREGAATFAEYYRMASGPADTREALEEVYGRSLEELEAEYLETAPYSWVPFRQCTDIPHVEHDDDGVWRHSAILDCDDESTMGPYLDHEDLFIDEWKMMAQSFTFTVDDEVILDYDLHGDVERVVLQRCGDEPPASAEEYWVAIRETALLRKGSLGEQSHPRLSPGTWRADVLRLHGGPASVGVAIWVDPDPPVP